MKSVNENVPQKSKQPLQKNQPWMNSEIREAFTRRNRAWKRYRNYKSDFFWSAYTSIRNETNRLVRKAKEEYYQPVSLTSVCGKLLERSI